MTWCLEIEECEGVTFAHRYSGDYLAKGFYHGYGYQLRKASLIKEKYKFFEFSFVKREFKLGK